MKKLREIAGHYSTWVVTLVSVLGAWWLQLSPADQASYTLQFPFLSKVGPYLAFLAFVIAKMAPQDKKETPNAEDPAQKG